MFDSFREKIPYEEVKKILDERYKETKPRVVVLKPGEYFHYRHDHSWDSLYEHMLLKRCSAVNVCRCYLPSQCATRETIINPGVPLGKNPHVDNPEPFCGYLDYDYILWIDSDMTFTPECFDRLLVHDKPIVAGDYVRGDQQGLTGAVKNSEGVVDRVGAYNTQGLEEVYFVGFGFMLIRRGVLETIPFPWTDHLDLHDPHEGTKQASVDVSFCHRAHKAGFQVYVDGKVTQLLGHLKTHELKASDIGSWQLEPNPFKDMSSVEENVTRNT